MMIKEVITKTLLLSFYHGYISKDDLITTLIEIWLNQELNDIPF